MAIYICILIYVYISKGACNGRFQSSKNLTFPRRQCLCAMCSQCYMQFLVFVMCSLQSRPSLLRSEHASLRSVGRMHACIYASNDYIIYMGMGQLFNCEAWEELQISASIALSRSEIAITFTEELYVHVCPCAI